MTQNEKSYTGVFLILSLFLTAVMLYLLSPGPTVWLTTNGYLSESVFITFIAPLYQPLAWLSEHFIWCENFYEWYFALWGFR